MGNHPMIWSRTCGNLARGLVSAFSNTLAAAWSRSRSPKTALRRSSRISESSRRFLTSHDTQTLNLFVAIKRPLEGPGALHKSTLVLAALFALSACAREQVPDEYQSASNDEVSASLIGFNDQTCIRNGRPAQISFTNNSDRPTRNVGWTFTVFEQNHSTNLAAVEYLTSLTDPERTTDRIIAPGETYSLCSTMPDITGNADPDSLIYQVSARADF